MSKVGVIVVLGVVSYLLSFGCGGDKHGTGPVPVVADTVYVNVNYTGIGDGSSTNPYNSLTGAVAAADPGDVLLIAAGEYSDTETFPIYIKPGMTIRGAGRDETYIRGQLLDMTQDDIRPVTLEDLSCEGFTFGRNEAPSAPSETNRVRRCRVIGDLGSLHGGGHHFEIDSCIVVGRVRFGHGSGNSRDIMRRSDINGTVAFGSGAPLTEGELVQVITDCRVSDGIHFASGPGGTDTIFNCHIDSVGIEYISGTSNVYIAYNIIDKGQIRDGSGYGDQIITHNVITCTGADEAAIYASGAGDLITHNTINAYGGAMGIYAISGYPTYIDSNLVRVSGGGACLFTESGAGQIVGNTFKGGSIGATDSSGTLLFAHNCIDSCGIGVIIHSAARYVGNTITNCTGDGMIIDYTGYAVDSNTIAHNGGAGVRITGAQTDLGGGSRSGLGGNIIINNLGWNLVNETADTVWAKYNHWDNPDSLAIDASDIYDDDENASLGPVIFMPPGN